MREKFLAIFGLIALLLFAGCGDSSTDNSDEPDGDVVNECTSDEDCRPGTICDTSKGECVTHTPNVGSGEDGDLDSDPEPEREAVAVDGDEEEIVEEEREIRCDDYRPCTEDTLEDGECVFTIKQDYCLIDDTCYTNGVRNPENACRMCRPVLDHESWSNANDGESCNDGHICTENDACFEGVCEGAPKSCDDLQPCTDDACVEPSGCRFVPNDENCEAHEYCDATLGCIATGCEPGTFRCVGEERQRCDEFGDWFLFETCGEDTPVCTVDGCFECTPGDTRCQGEIALLCNDEGFWESEYCLGGMPSCMNGQCVACTEGEFWCGELEPDSEDWGVFLCVDGVWQLQQDCEEPTPMCGDLQDGEGLQCLECPPGQYRCVEHSHQVCDEQGIWQLDPCPTERPYCEMGRCFPCRIGDSRCGIEEDGENPNDLYVCWPSDEDAYWGASEPCPPETPNCVDGQCEACTPGESRCDPNDPDSTIICNDDGYWVDGPDCENGEWCDPETGECTSGQSLYFDGNAKMEIPDDMDYDPDAEFTLEAWILPTELTGNCDTGGNTIMEKWAAWPVGTYLLAVCSDFYGRPNVARFFAIVDEGVEDYLHSSDNSINVGEWNHIAVVWADDRMDMFINGVREVARPNYIGWKRPNSFQQNSLDIGRLDDWEVWGFRGYIDEIRISKIARYDGATYEPQMFFNADEFTTGLWHLNDPEDENVCIDSAGRHDGINEYGATYSPYGVGEMPE